METQLQTERTTLKKNRIGGILFPDFRLCYKATIKKKKMYTLAQK